MRNRHSERSEESDLLWVVPSIARHLTVLDAGDDLNTIKSFTATARSTATAPALQRHQHKHKYRHYSGINTATALPLHQHKRLNASG